MYQSTSLRCSAIEDSLHSARRQCLLEAGLCDVTKVDWFLEKVTDLGGYPVKIPLLYNGPLQPVEVTFFRHKALFKGQVSLL